MYSFCCVGTPDLIVGPLIPPRQVNLSQDTVLKALGRVAYGYHSTPDDGNCAPLAIDQTVFCTTVYQRVCAQLRSRLALCAARRQLKTSRQRVEQIIRSNIHLQRLLPDERCAAILLRTPNGYGDVDNLPNNGENWKIIASQYGQIFGVNDKGKTIGMWYDEPAIRATAIALQKNIVVVPPTSPVYFYPKDIGPFRLEGTSQEFKTDQEPSIVCMTSNASPFLPSQALLPDTIVICHNGSNHFWYTDLSTDEHPTAYVHLPVIDLLIV